MLTYADDRLVCARNRHGRRVCVELQVLTLLALLVQAPGTHFTCSTSTKEQILTPEELQVLILLALLVEECKY